MKNLSERRFCAGYEVLRLDDGVRLEPDRILALFAELGEDGAESVVCRAIEELALRLAEMQRALAAADTRGLCRAADQLARVAQQIGMATLARVAGDVRACAKSGNGPGLAATMARLVRISDRSFAAAWDLQDLTQ